MKPVFKPIKKRHAINGKGQIISSIVEHPERTLDRLQTYLERDEDFVPLDFKYKKVKPDPMNIDNMMEHRKNYRKKNNIQFRTNGNKTHPMPNII